MCVFNVTAMENGGDGSSGPSVHSNKVHVLHMDLCLLNLHVCVQRNSNGEWC